MNKSDERDLIRFRRLIIIYVYGGDEQAYFDHINSRFRESFPGILRNYDELCLLRAKINKPSKSTDTILSSFW